jgi:hypothetical protein
MSRSTVTRPAVSRFGEIEEVVMRIRFSLRWLLAFVALSGCWSAAEPSVGSSVVITNASTVALTDVHVTTGPDDVISDASIAAGATTAARSVHAVYQAIHVAARVENQSVSVIPIEGFVDGFNTRLPDGTYTVLLVVPSQPNGMYWLEARVSPNKT